MFSENTRARSIAAACFMVQAVGVGTLVTYGVFFSSFVEELQWSRAVISGASSLALFLSGLFAMLVGRLTDRYGPRLLMSVSAVLIGIGHVLMAGIEEIWQLYLFYGVVFGVGLSAVDVIALSTTARWFTRSRGMMTGIVKVGTGAGQLFVPLAASFLIASFGWRRSYVILGLGASLLLFLIAQVLKRDPGVGKRRLSVPKTAASGDGSEDSEGLNVLEALRTVQLWLLFAMTFLIEFGLFIIIVHIVPHACDIGLAPAKAAGVLSMIGAVSMIGRFVSGAAIDRTGSKAIMIVCFIILFVSMLWLQIAASLWMLYLFASIYGLAHGSFFTAISPIVAETFGIRAHGALFGIIVFAGTTGGAVGPITAGYVFDQTGSYATVFWVITLLSIMGLALIAMIKPVRGLK